MNNKVSIVIDSNISEIKEVFKGCRRFADNVLLPMDIFKRLLLICDEILSNIIRHGLKDRSGHKVKTSFSSYEDVIEISFEDDALPFDPLQISYSSRGEEDLLQEGGLGLHLVKNTADAIKYDNYDNKNHLTVCLMVKKPSKGSSRGTNNKL